MGLYDIIVSARTSYETWIYICCNRWKSKHGKANVNTCSGGKLQHVKKRSTYKILADTSGKKKVSMSYALAAYSNHFVL